MRKRILITGCSGGGKTTLLNQLAVLGFRTIAEPGRRIIAQAKGPDDPVLPWNDPVQFAQKAAGLAKCDLEKVQDVTAPVFFDRGLLDAAVGLHHMIGVPLRDMMGDTLAYYQDVVVIPPWSEIYKTDADRRHDFVTAVQEYERIIDALVMLGYNAIHLPKTHAAARADYVLSTFQNDRS